MQVTGQSQLKPLRHVHQHSDHISHEACTNLHISAHTHTITRIRLHEVDNGTAHASFLKERQKQTNLRSKPHILFTCVSEKLFTILSHIRPADVFRMHSTGPFSAGKHCCCFITTSAHMQYADFVNTSVRRQSAVI